MTPFEITILGSNSAVPTPTRHPTSQLLNINHHYYLIDCGEGAQIQMRKFGIKFQRIEHIFISHLHGDHYFGLIGLLNSFGLLNRQQDLQVYGPAGLQEIIALQLQAASTRLPFLLHFHTIQKAGQLAETEDMVVSCFPTDHRIECYGFLFQEKNLPRKFNDKRSKPRTYAYCADTRYDERIIEVIKEVDLLYHEATYLEDQVERATLRYHSTSTQAAQIARKANVGKLLLRKILLYILGRN